MQRHDATMAMSYAQRRDEARREKERERKRRQKLRRQEERQYGTERPRDVWIPEEYRDATNPNQPQAHRAEEVTRDMEMPPRHPRDDEQLEEGEDRRIYVTLSKQ